MRHIFRTHCIDLRMASNMQRHSAINLANPGHTAHRCFEITYWLNQEQMAWCSSSTKTQRLMMLSFLLQLSYLSFPYKFSKSWHGVQSLHSNLKSCRSSYSLKNPRIWLFHQSHLVHFSTCRSDSLIRMLTDWKVWNTKVFWHVFISDILSSIAVCMQ